MKYRTLGASGPVISQLGFGASPLGGIYGTFAEQDGRPENQDPSRAS